jgi:hypothetical protein
VLQKATDLIETILSIDIGFEVWKRLIAKSYGEVGKLQQTGKELGNLLACLLFRPCGAGSWLAQGLS